MNNAAASRGVLFTILVLSATTAFARGPGQSQRAQRELASKERIGRIAVPFLRNEGQTDAAVAYYVPTFVGTAFITRRGEIVYSLPPAEERRGRRPGASPVRPSTTRGGGWTLTETPVSGTARPVGRERAWARASFFLGNQPARWKSGVATYDVLSLGEVWPGVEMRLEAHGRNIEKLFEVGPGVDPSGIRMRIGGASRVRLDGTGALLVETGLGPVTFTPPSAFQERDGVREPVLAAYRLKGREYGFRLGPHDPELPVVIDPLLQSTYLGGAGFDQINDIAFHPTTGEVYVAGFTAATAFPGVAGGAQSNYGGGVQDGFVARLTADLTDVLQATYLGGNAFDHINALAISPAGDVYVSGETNSPNFPVSAGVPQTTLAGGTDVFVARFDANLTSLVKATLFGGAVDDHATRAIAVHPTTGDVYVGGFGQSENLPGTTGAAQPAFGGYVDSFLARYSSTLTTLSQATYFGGVGFDQLFALRISPSAGIYVTGITGSSDLPGSSTGGQPSPSPGFGATDAFAALFNASLTGLTRSSYYGGNGLDTAFDVALHPTSGDVYIAGGTSSTDLPATATGAQPGLAGRSDSFVSRFNGALTTILRATYKGGFGGEGANSVTVHPDTGDVYIAGVTDSRDYPGTAAGAQGGHGGGYIGSLDAFVSRFNSSLTGSLDPSTYLGGTGEDEAITVRVHPTTGDVYTGGYTSSADFPRTAGGAQETYGANPADAFFVRLTPALEAILAPAALVVDPAPTASSDGNGVFEPGETAAVQPAWRNVDAVGHALTGAASGFAGPPGAVYSLVDSSAVYGTIAPTATRSCAATPNCYSMSVSAPATRPILHWDTTFLETPSTIDTAKLWTLHIGESFTDVPRSHLFYRFVETIFHHGVTGGCGTTIYCPDNTVTRGQMSVFLLRGKHGISFLPPNPTGIFNDVPIGTSFAPWVEQLFHEGITAGCGGGNYCPNNPLTRAQMAVFLLVAKHGSGYVPPPATGIFPDVPVSHPFVRWVEQLFNEGISAGCGGGLFCPDDPNIRGQMAVFLTVTFGLDLYGP